MRGGSQFLWERQWADVLEGSEVRDGADPVSGLLMRGADEEKFSARAELVGGGWFYFFFSVGAGGELDVRTGC